MAKGRWQKAEGKRQKAEGKGQKEGLMHLALSRWLCFHLFW